MAADGNAPAPDPRQELARIRTDLGLTQRELADLAGVSEADLAAMEAGEQPVPQELLVEILEELNAKGA